MLGVPGVGWATGASPTAPPLAATPPQAAPAAHEVAALVGAARCRVDSDCATIALPDQACGGPAGWLPFAVGSTDRKALRRALDRAAAAPAAAAGRAVSTCAVVPDPGAVCAAAPPAGGQALRSCRLRSVRNDTPGLPSR